MKIFTVKRVIGLAAIYGVVHYVRKQGGFGKMIEGLTARANPPADQAEQANEPLGATTRTASTPTRVTTPTTSSSFGASYSGGSGSDGVGGGGNRH